MSRGFLICPEPVRRLTAGVGTRFVALARVLVGAGHRVTLAIPNDPAESELRCDGLTVVNALPDGLGAAAGGHDWVLLHGHLGNHYLCQRDDLPVVVDLYDPFLVENLHYHAKLGLEPYRTDHATWRLQLGRGDLFLCSSAEQRLFYLGWLGALGRLHPLAHAADPTLEQLIVELPFGTPEEAPPPPPTRAAAAAGVADDAPVLYFGGLYDWYDPEVVLAALPRLREADPRTVVVFADHPHPDLTPQSVWARTRRAARQRGWLGDAVRFEPWRPFERRFELPQVADHRPGLETTLSLRTRLVDLLWLGVPVVATAGGTMSRVVEEVGAGTVVPPGDPEALADAVLQLLGDRSRRQRAAEAGRGWAAGRTWSALARPLLEFAAAPRRDPHRDRFGALAPGSVLATDSLGTRLRRRLRRLVEGA